MPLCVWQSARLLAIKSESFYQKKVRQPSLPKLVVEVEEGGIALAHLEPPAACSIIWKNKDAILYWRTCAKQNSEDCGLSGRQQSGAHSVLWTALEQRGATAWQSSTTEKARLRLHAWTQSVPKIREKNVQRRSTCGMLWMGLTRSHCS